MDHTNDDVAELYSALDDDDDDDDDDVVFVFFVVVVVVVVPRRFTAASIASCFSSLYLSLLSSLLVKTIGLSSAMNSLPHPNPVSSTHLS